ncbi:hypothetical protein KFL_000330140 [Klebsormidium nitens]|uniref:O-fucosyltransferase family protein n=1 Tax=Klebsormidium nitens TaxID=105231 RepID=A0A1Y1HUN9_KLENI|nr:hypothetical protein KFL_000330140 [Klebsormidium nitens]|eukprot:GAQ79568.1 hypothetical protein KFL_000330140 [Klebsormidium nitens]
MGKTPIMRSALLPPCTTIAALLVLVICLVLSVGFVLRTDSGQFKLAEQVERTVICNCTPFQIVAHSPPDVPLKLPPQPQLPQPQLVENPEHYVSTTCRGAYNDTQEEEKRVRKSLEWNPRPDKYLLAWCLMGKFTNRLICHMKFMTISALLGRTLIWPQEDFQFNYTTALDMPRVKRCFTPESQRANSDKVPIILTLEEYREQGHNENVTIRCLQADCLSRVEMAERFDQQGFAYHEDEDNPDWGLEFGAITTLKQVQDRYAPLHDVGVLAIGDPYGIDIREEERGDSARVVARWTSTGIVNSWNLQSGNLTAQNCAPAVLPNEAIMVAARNFVRAFFGAIPFLSIHIRRGDFFEFDHLMPSITDVGLCIRATLLVHPEMKVVFAATNASPPELALLRQLVQVPIVVLDNDHTIAASWNNVLENQFGANWNEDTLILSMLDKAICSLSTVFLSSSLSTFSLDILRIRRGLGNVHCHDGDFCKAMQYWY